MGTGVQQNDNQKNFHPLLFWYISKISIVSKIHDTSTFIFCKSILWIPYRSEGLPS